MSNDKDVFSKIKNKKESAEKKQQKSKDNNDVQEEYGVDQANDQIKFKVESEKKKRKDRRTYSYDLDIIDQIEYYSEKTGKTKSQIANMGLKFFFEHSEIE